MIVKSQQNRIELVARLLSHHTGMERIKVLTDLRSREVKFPSDAVMLSDEQRSLIRWLLNHEPEKRPTSAELLQSHYLPPPQVIKILSSTNLGKKIQNIHFFEISFFSASHFGQNLMRNLIRHSCKFDSILQFFLQKPGYLFVIKC